MANDRPKQPNAFLRSLAFLGNLGAFIFPIGSIALISVPVVIVYQITQWMQSGRWPSISFADGLRWLNLAQPHFESPTLEKTSASLMASPLSLVLLFGVGGALFLYARFSKWLEKYCEPARTPPEGP